MRQAAAFRRRMTRPSPARAAPNSGKDAGNGTAGSEAGFTETVEKRVDVTDPFDTLWNRVEKTKVAGLSMRNEKDAPFAMFTVKVSATDGAGKEVEAESTFIV